MAWLIYVFLVGVLTKGVIGKRDPVLRGDKVMENDAVDDPVANEDPVDFVYCWAGETQEGCSISRKEGDPENKSGSLAATHDGGCDLGEMLFSLRSLRKYAPWARNIFILVDGPSNGEDVPYPSFVDEETAGPVKMVNRCGLFDRAEDCPTMNTHACQSVIHRIPGLANKFVYMEDDDVLANPLRKNDLWDEEGRARVFDHSDGELSRVYGAPENLSGPDLPPAHVPMKLSEQVHHAPIPVRRDALEELEAHYKEFMAFVRSHTRRFICCDATHQAGAAVTEDLAPIWMAWLVKTGKGVLDESRRDVFCPVQNGYSVDCFRGHFLSTGEIFANLNSASPGKQWDQVQAILMQKLAEPAPHEPKDTVAPLPVADHTFPTKPALVGTAGVLLVVLSIGVLWYQVVGSKSQ
jgi:hypothetical protein